MKLPHVYYVCDNIGYNCLLTIYCRVDQVNFPFIINFDGWSEFTGLIYDMNDPELFDKIKNITAKIVQDMEQEILDDKR